MCCSIHVIKLVMYDIFHVLNVYIYTFLKTYLQSVCFTWNIISSLKSTFLAIFGNHPLCSCFLRSCQYHRWTTTQRCWVIPQWHPPSVGGNSIAVSTGQKDSRVTSRCDEVLVGKCFITSQMAVWNKPPFFPELEFLFLYSQFQHAIFCLSVKCKAYLYISFVLS